MKQVMKQTVKHLFFVFASLFLFSAAAQDVATIAAPSARQDTVVQADKKPIPPCPEIGPNQTAIFQPDTGTWVVEDNPPMPERTLWMLFLEGGYTWMTAVTLCFVAMLFAAWKAPRWVRELGLLALTIGFLSLMVGLYGVFGVVQSYGNVSFSLCAGGFRVGLIAPIYGVIVYVVSLVLRIALKPRI